MPYDDAARFLARAVPWPPLAAAQPEWFVNIHVPWRLPNGKLAYGGRACTTLKEALNFIEWKLGGDQTGDIYVCMSGQQRAKAKTNKAGRVYYSAVRGTQNALWHKGFYIDIDVKKGGFASTEAALEAFGIFRRAVDLPLPSYVVASGSGGVHVHWSLDEPIDHDRWQPIAHMLVTAMRQHGFAVDYACTADAARLLRVPDTLNYKHNPPKPVELLYTGHEYQLGRIEDVLLTYKSTVTVASGNGVLKRRQNNMDMPPGIMDRLVAGTAFNELVPNQQKNLPTLTMLADCCPFVKQAVLKGGADYRQTLWWETAKLAFYTSRGVDALHDMSKLHHQYTPKETDELYDRITRERTPRDDYGWPQCDTIEVAGARECGACKWKIAGRTAGNSPLNFIGEHHDAPDVSRETPKPNGAVEVVQDGPFGFIPDPYRFDDTGRIWKDETNKDGETEPVMVFPYPVRNFEVAHEPSWAVQFEASMNQHGYRPILIPCAEADTRSLCRLLGKNGLPLRGVFQRYIGDLMSSFVEQLHDRRRQSVPIETSGWVFDDGQPSAFVYGRTRYNCSGDRPAAMLDYVMQRMYAPTGSIEPWRKAMKMITNQKRAALEVIVAASFGAPFMTFAGEAGLVVCARSGETAVHKSSAMKVASAIWGHPKESMQQTMDTVNSVTAKIGTLRNFPIFWDEVQLGKQVTALIQLFFDLTHGKSKSRLSRDANQQGIASWATLLIMASNRSLRAAAAENAKESNAVLYRVFEYEVPAPSNRQGYNEDAQIILSELNNNFGCAGAVLAKYCGTHPTEIGPRLQFIQKRLRDRFKATEAERFWIAGIACILFGAQLANDLGLAEFDLPMMIDFLEREFMRNRAYIEGSDVGFHKTVNVTSFIANFCNDPRNFVLQTDTVPGQGKPGTIHAPNLPSYVKGLDFCAQVVADPPVVRLSSRALHHYCKLQEIQADALVKELAQKFGAEKRKVTLGAGTSLKRPSQEYVFEIDRNHPDLKDLFS